MQAVSDRARCADRRAGGRVNASDSAGHRPEVGGGCGGVFLTVAEENAKMLSARNPPPFFVCRSAASLSLICFYHFAGGVPRHSTKKILNKKVCLRYHHRVGWTDNDVCERLSPPAAVWAAAEACLRTVVPCKVSSATVGCYRCE